MADKLVSMKISPGDRERKNTLCCSEDEELFPHGITMHLDDDVLKKLGMNKEGSFKKGEKMMLKAIVNIDRVSMEDRMGEDPEMTVGLQITDMAIGPVEKSNAEVIFDKS